MRKFTEKVRYHVTPYGPRICSATIRDCKYGNDIDHFNTREEAQEMFEDNMKHSHGQFKTYKKPV